MRDNRVVGDSGDSQTTDDVHDDGGEVIHGGFSILRANRRDYSAKRTRAAPINSILIDWLHRASRRNTMR